MRQAYFIFLVLWAPFAEVAIAKPPVINQTLIGDGSQIVASAKFVRLHDGKTLYSFNEQSALVPASVTKLFTAAAVLHHYKPHHQIETTIFYDGSLSGGVLNGNLYIAGRGDPYLISEKLWQLAADLSHRGLRQVKGHLIIDDSLFDDVSHDESRLNGAARSNNAYDAPITSFGLNFNTLAVAIAPGDKVGSPARVHLDPYDINGVRIHNQVKTIQGSRHKISVDRVSDKNGRVTIHVKGSIGVDHGVEKVYRSITDSQLISGELMRAFLSNRGIELVGGIKAGRPPSQAKVLHILKGYPISMQVEGLNKYSNNYIADVLTKKLSTDFGAKREGSFAEGSAVISQFAKQYLGVDKKFVIKNGSGLDTDNRLSADHVVSLLAYMEKRLDIFPDFLSSLPASGADGTLKERFNGDQSGTIRAKTGTLTQPISVSSLAGYLRHKKHGLVAFALLQNGIKGKNQPGIDQLRRSQERVLHEIMQQY